MPRQRTIAVGWEDVVKLLYSPGDCSVGIHIVLEEIGRPYQTDRVNFSCHGETSSLGKIVGHSPSLSTDNQIDRSVVAENVVLATF
jgi:glutathione S-transferase